MGERQPDAPTLTRIAETDAIRRLLGSVLQRERTPPPAPEPDFEPAVAEPRPPEAAFVAQSDWETPTEALAPSPEPPVALVLVHSEVSVEVEEPPPLPPRVEAAPPAPAPVEPPPPVPLPVGALSFGALLERINWRNRPGVTPPLPLIGVPDPPGHSDTVGAVLAAFSWDDE